MLSLLVDMAQLLYLQFSRLLGLRVPFLAEYHLFFMFSVLGRLAQLFYL